MRASIVVWLVTLGCGRLCFEPLPSLGTGSDGSSGTPIAIVQNEASRGGDVAMFTGVYYLAQQAGDLNVVVVDTSVPVASVSDSADNQYQLAIGPVMDMEGGSGGSGGRNLYVYYAANIAASPGDTNTVSVTTTTTSGDFGIRTLEYSGIAASSPVDGAVGSANVGLVANSGALTTTHAHDLLVGANIFEQSVAMATPLFTTRDLTGGDDIEDRIVDATGVYEAPLTGNASGGWVVELVAFKGAD